MAFEIRPLAAADLAPVYEWIEGNPLFARYGMSRKTLSAGLEHALADPGALVVGAFAPGGKLSGFAWFVKKGAFARSGYLRLIVVDPAAESSGTGRALMGHLEAKHLKPNGIFLLTTDSNAEAQAFYAKLGYRKVGEIPDYVHAGLTEWIYHKAPPRP